MSVLMMAEGLTLPLPAYVSVCDKTLFSALLYYSSLFLMYWGNWLDLACWNPWSLSLGSKTLVSVPLFVIQKLCVPGKFQQPFLICCNAFMTFPSFTNQKSLTFTYIFHDHK
jgi:hypothetical protein